ncbi:lipopolysaccharide biosynthesis protein [Ruminococcus flavefaciens]|uniref:lipopolysaccharide biosynthesis protein n=1 Tax=Ruminococcus flavefaciens TaxID=1265 RepID=UPI0026F1E2CD|nr:oligosaccharide flippase family protein [Ruminococcus flavefaciens]
MKKTGITKYKEILSNLSITIIANLVSLMGSIIITFLLPKFIGVESFGYYQLYIFYTSYIGFLGFGWHEGIYLRFGGKYYKDLDKSLFKTQFIYYSLLELIVSFIICIVGLIFSSGNDKQTIFIMTALCVLIYLPRAYLHNILQAVNNIRSYAVAMVIEKTVHMILTCILLVLHIDSYLCFIISELCGRLIAGIYILIICKEIISAKSYRFKTVLDEIKINMKTGITLTLANISSLLIIGVVRQAIEIKWDVETFGKISLTLSVSNLLMVFVRAVSTTLFPMLRRTDNGKLKDIYSFMRSVLMTFLLGMLILCYPIQSIVSAWLPKYSDTLKYLSVLFPLCVFECKSSMLIETFLKTIRKEKSMLLMNGITVFLSVVLTIITVFVIHDLDAAVFSIVFLVAFRSVLGELLLSKFSKIDIVKNMIAEIIATTLFVVFNYFVGGWLGFGLYFIAFLIYLIIFRNDIKSSVRRFV